MATVPLNSPPRFLVGCIMEGLLFSFPVSDNTIPGCREGAKREEGWVPEWSIICLALTFSKIGSPHAIQDALAQFYCCQMLLPGFHHVHSRGDGVISDCLDSQTYLKSQCLCTLWLQVSSLLTSWNTSLPLFIVCKAISHCTKSWNLKKIKQTQNYKSQGFNLISKGVNKCNPS